MIRLKKAIATMGLVIAIGIAAGGNASACTATPECGATGTTVVCGTQYGSTTTHTIRYPNGYVGTCVVTTVSAQHKIYCSGCGALLKTEFRTCAIEHSDSHCFDSHNLCK